MQLITDQRTADIVDGKIPVKDLNLAELYEMQGTFSRILSKIRSLISAREKYESLSGSNNLPGGK